MFSTANGAALEDQAPEPAAERAAGEVDTQEQQEETSTMPTKRYSR